MCIRTRSSCSRTMSQLAPNSTAEKMASDTPGNRELPYWLTELGAYTTCLWGETHHTLNLSLLCSQLQWNPSNHIRTPQNNEDTSYRGAPEIRTPHKSGHSPIVSGLEEFHCKPSLPHLKYGLPGSPCGVMNALSSCIS